MNEVLNDPCAPPGRTWGQVNPIHPPTVDVIEVTTAAKLHSPVEDPLNFKDVPSGVEKAQKDTQCVYPGAEQAAESTTKDQGTVATCPCPEKAPKTVQDMLAINPSPVEAPQPAPPRLFHRLQHLCGFIFPECYDLI